MRAFLAGQVKVPSVSLCQEATKMIETVGRNCESSSLHFSFAQTHTMTSTYTGAGGRTLANGEKVCPCGPIFHPAVPSSSTSPVMARKPATRPGNNRETPPFLYGCPYSCLARLLITQPAFVTKSAPCPRRQRVNIELEVCALVPLPL